MYSGTGEPFLLGCVQYNKKNHHLFNNICFYNARQVKAEKE